MVKKLNLVCFVGEMVTLVIVELMDFERIFGVIDSRLGIRGARSKDHRLESLFLYLDLIVNRMLRSHDFTEFWYPENNVEADSCRNTYGLDI